MRNNEFLSLAILIRKKYIMSRKNQIFESKSMVALIEMIFWNIYLISIW